MYGNGWMYGMPMMGWGGWIVMIIFWVLVVAGIILLVGRLSSRRSPPGPAEKTPVDLLKERYARGEIDREEFEQKKRDLE